MPDARQFLSLSDLRLESLRGQYCWGMEFHRYLNLSMHFGSPRLRVTEPRKCKSPSEVVRRSAAHRLVTPEGRWWLWLRVARWSILEHGTTLASFSSSDRKRRAAMVDLEGQKLTGLQVDVRTGASRFTFDLGCVLLVRRFNRDDDCDLYLLYKPSGYVLSIRSDGTYDHEPGSGIDRRPAVIRRPLVTLWRRRGK